ncbi:MAG: hypothetical protein MIO93_10770, partial [ANME-2 cluster archaeon]|nr:hypothetical protein [ANME-2 cluster archaeon]
IKIKATLYQMNKVKDEKEMIDFLNDLTDRLEAIESRISNIESRFNPVIEDKMALFLTVPDTIRKSLFAVSQLGNCNADEVSEVTKRHRSIENKYLNELVRSGWLQKKRNGKKIYYSLKKSVGSNKSEYQTAVNELELKLDELLG